MIFVNIWKIPRIGFEQIRNQGYLKRLRLPGNVLDRKILRLFVVTSYYEQHPHGAFGLCGLRASTGLHIGSPMYQ